MITKDCTGDIVREIDECLEKEELLKDQELVVICTWVREKLLEQALDSDELLERIQEYATRKRRRKPTLASDLEKALTMGRPLDVFVGWLHHLK